MKIIGSLSVAICLLTAINSAHARVEKNDHFQDNPVVAAYERRMIYEFNKKQSDGFTFEHFIKRYPYSDYETWYVIKYTYDSMILNSGTQTNIDSFRSLIMRYGSVANN